MNKTHNDKLRFVVTGSDGRLGRVLMQALTKAGINCQGVSSTAKVEFRPNGEFAHRKADLTCYGDAIDALKGADVVIHLANLSYPGFYPDHETFSKNVGMNYNVFAAASELKCRRVVWMSTANVTGIDTQTHIPERFPIGEDQAPRLSSAYALSKSVSESTAQYFGNNTNTTYVGVRASLVVYPEDHELLRNDADNAEIRRWQYWSYVDVRDLCDLLVQAACSSNEESTVVNASAADTILNRDSASLCAEYFPDTRCEIEPGTTNSLFCIEKAKRLYGYDPKRSWRQ